MKRNLLLQLVALGYFSFSFAQSSPNEQRALEYIRSKANEFQINPLHDFKLRFVSNGEAGEILRFQQMIQNVPVFGAEFVVNFNSKKELVYSSNSYDKSVAIIDVTPTINKTDAVQFVNQALQAGTDIVFQESNLFVYNSAQGTKLAYKVNTQMNSKPGDWEVFVDAKTGEILSLKDVSVFHHQTKEDKEKRKLEWELIKNSKAPFFKAPFAFVSGTGMIYNPDPLSAAHVPYAGNYVDGNDATNAQLDAARTSVVLPEIDLTAGVYRLKSSYLDIGDFEAPNKGLFTQATSAFNFNRNNDAFEAVNSFYHMDNSLRYIDQTLGVVCVPQQNGGDLLYDPSGLSGADNSHFIPSSDRIAFGEGCVDDAEDADVVLHELGHGLHDWMTGGSASSNQGLGEGSGDYWAHSYSRSLNQWASNEPEYNYMFSWDGHNPCWGGRITNYTAAYPGGLTGSIHTDGQIWATALMKIYDVIGRTKMDKAFLQGLALTNSASTQTQAAVAVRQAAINMNYPCADIKTMTTIFTATGYTMPALPFTITCPGNQTVTAGAGNTYTVPSYSGMTNAISPNCNAVITQSPAVGAVLAPGTYPVTMTATDGTSVNCGFNLTVQPALSVQDFQKLNFKLYPNPANSTITVAGENIANEKVAIYNLLGQKVYEKELWSTENKIDISFLSKGVYTLKFEKTKDTVKFVKQ